MNVIVVPVLGCQRSGTTLLGQMLGAPGRSLLVDEDDGVYRLLDAVAAAGCMEDAVIRPYLQKALAKYADGRQAGNSPHPLTHLVLKVPNGTFHPEALAGWGTPVRPVFAVRDVRDVVCSMRRMRDVPMIANQLRRMQQAPGIRDRFGAEIALLARDDVPDHAKFAIIWKVKSSLYGDFVAAGHPTLLVRYEDLVADPLPWKARLFTHVGLPADFDAPAHDQVMRGTAIGKTDRNRPVDAASVGRWRMELDAKELADIQEVVGDLMDRLQPPSRGDALTM